jgi:predicted DsbA family dithiol-disulfide isomerase
MTRATMEVFADVACPFTHVGLRRIVARRTELGRAQPILRVRAWPLELVNGTPLDPAAVAEHVAELREQAAPDLFRGFDQATFPSSSMPALELVADAYAMSDDIGEQVSLAIRTALFEEGHDISDPGVLDGIADANGVITRDESAHRAVLADYEEGKRRGVRGSPEFYLEGRGWFCPALRIEKVDDRLEIALDREGFEVFLAECFA